MKKSLLILLLLILTASVMVVSAQTDDATPEPPQPVISPTPVPLTLNPLLGFQTIPPYEITLPEGWVLALRDTFTYEDVVTDVGDGLLETLPLDVYTGPLSNGAQGWIVVPWGYDSIVPYDPELTDEEYQERVVWLNGLRMLQFVVFDARCNIGTAPQREYTIGELPALGTSFQAIDCPFSIPDTRGWFAALNLDGLNFAFFAYADPLQPQGSTFQDELQAILDTIVFDIDSITITADEFQATQQALILTPRPTIIVNPTAQPTVTPTTTP